LSNLGDEINAKTGSWTFGGSVAKTFDAHIQKSVPGYLEGHDLVSKMAPFFLGRTGSIFTEVGCSTGALIQTVRKQNDRNDLKFVGIDIEEAMLEIANENNEFDNCDFEFGDALTYQYEGSDVVASYYTIQFINPSIRQKVINKIYESLNWGGAFIMFEKVRGPDARFQDMMTTLYNEYKLSQGYSEKEIIGKTLSLKGILEPFSSTANIDMLKRAGFSDINIVFKRLSFEGYLAIK
jgi:tRNA (cmo5U34)-methyltransferase